MWPDEGGADDGRECAVALQMGKGGLKLFCVRVSQSPSLRLKSSTGVYGVEKQLVLGGKVGLG